MELKQLHFFVVSADTGSFKKAAEVLYTTQPYVSKTIKALETEMQVELFHRTPGGVELTEAGKRVYAQARSILRKMELLHQAREEEPGRRLCVSVVPNGKLVELFVLFCQMEKAGDIRYQLLEATVEDIMVHMQRHVSEIGLVYIAQRQLAGFSRQLEHKRLEFIPLKKTEPCLLVGKNSPLYGLSSVDSSVLHTVKLVQPKEDFYSISAYSGLPNENVPAACAAQAVVCTNSNGVVEGLLECTDMGTVSLNLLPGESKRHKLWAIPLGAGKASIHFGYIKRKRNDLSPAARQFVAYLEKILREN